MVGDNRHIIAGSTGFISADGYFWDVGPVLQFALSLSKSKRPRIAFIGTATGDDRRSIAQFYHACSKINVTPSHLQLFPLPNHANVEEYILSQDVIWVNGGSVANLLAIWRTHGLDEILRKAWERGVILTGQSAGAICWNMGGTTDSFGIELRPITNGLGFLPYSCGVHYDSEAKRRPLFHRLIADGVIPDGYATDDGVNIYFQGTEIRKAFSDTPEKYAYKVYRDDNGAVKEEVIVPELLA